MRYGVLASIIVGVFCASPLFADQERSTKALPERHGRVRLVGTSLHDAAGPFLGLGATYMQALRHCKYDRPRLVKELAFLQACGFNYVRVLSMVDWPGQEIPPVDYVSREHKSVPAWDDYDNQLGALLAAARDAGLRLQITLFADAQRIVPSREARTKHVDRIANLVRAHLEAVCLLEVANEGWQNGFPDEQGVRELRELGSLLKDKTNCLVALSAPPSLPQGLVDLYAGSRADLATVHFSRDIGADEQHWKPVLDCWEYAGMRGIPPLASNEPIGPGASVSSENDPAYLLAAAAFAYIANLPMYVFHSRAGTSAESSFADLGWLPRFGALTRILPPDLPAWERNDGLAPSSPFDVFLDGDSGAYWQKRGEHRQGALRVCGARKGDSFVALPLGILDGGVTLQARKHVSFTEYALPECVPVAEHEMKSGDRCTLRSSSGVCLLVGRMQNRQSSR